LASALASGNTHLFCSRGGAPEVHNSLEGHFRTKKVRLGCKIGKTWRRHRRANPGRSGHSEIPAATSNDDWASQITAELGNGSALAGRMAFLAARRLS